MKIVERRDSKGEGRELGFVILPRVVAYGPLVNLILCLFVPFFLLNFMNDYDQRVLWWYDMNIQADPGKLGAEVSEEQKL